MGNLFWDKTIWVPYLSAMKPFTPTFSHEATRASPLGHGPHGQRSVKCMIDMKFGENSRIFLSCFSIFIAFPIYFSILWGCSYHLSKNPPFRVDFPARNLHSLEIVPFFYSFFPGLFVHPWLDSMAQNQQGLRRQNVVDLAAVCSVCSLQPWGWAIHMALWLGNYS